MVCSSKNVLLNAIPIGVLLRPQDSPRPARIWAHEQTPDATLRSRPKGP